ncbi:MULTISPECIES: histidinol dehydrogenase [unclassified Paenibacillus]|uniref:histidinol dehydrogenase n=1 Tax=unclassified Paenibacillus TaxID=185978 RepID=UPI0024066988|nr:MULTISPECIES: histidinol dehydrogenase [unclassified Paenibacillus]MDF9840716.1 histidinol dehydrogenase [Paenibacillus sp. PastF-2]MDF9847299.1 histidinol dehydrogenase [Paenibacillus sp. PastM-2]MDF9854123.1 histidinol dehydrogenase [Paenibacillus sp. PastF-1]MDH6479396.1 histidinol dehydrogenase [Paenibacillus sp. PastH-2]MDH6506871.1 histidinol dehydrogenase [Paenibacillus sp. PastM-3]
MKVKSSKDFKLQRDVEYGTPEQNETVKQIVATIKKEGDAALLRYTEQFDRTVLTAAELRVTPEELQAAYSQVEDSFVTAIRAAAVNIRAFHARQKRSSWMDLQPDGTILGQIIRPLKRVGVYVPGGTAAYPSSVLMNVIPAQIAGVPEIVMVTPPATGGKAGIDPYILVAAAEAGVNEIYRVGGAQAIAALAFGTESIVPVDKICGPGNIYVALAKREVYGAVDIDSIAGPSEIVVLADDTAEPAYVAADLLSQAEHDTMASAILVTPSQSLADSVAAEVERQLQELPREAVARASVENHGAIIVVDSLQEGIEVVNRLAPEHLEVVAADPMGLLGSIENAGAIFLGPYSSEPVGDYFAGPNHIIPTNGTARFASPVDVDDFIKKSSLIYYSKEALLRDGETIMELARREGLEGHARAIQIRLENEAKGGAEDGE